MRSLLLAAVLAAPAIVSAQEIDLDIKFGKVPKSDLEMMSYEPDTAASAVVLADIGTVTVDETGGLRFVRHRRIKILKPAGVKWADYSVSAYRVNKAQRIGKVEGRTHNLVDGKVRVTKMGKDAIFKEKATDEYDRVRFTLPAVEPGSVIEYRYTVTSDNPAYVPDWWFQDTEPTLYSEYNLEFPGFLNYAFALMGPRPDVQGEVTQLNRTYGDASRMRWAMVDAPAIRREPFMRALSDYQSRMRVQFAGYLDPGVGYIPVLGTWEKAAEDLGSSDFGRNLKPSRRIRDLALELTDGTNNERERVDALYEFVSRNIAWNGEYDWYTSRKYDDVLKTKSGDAVEVNGLLVSLLRALDIDADLLLISTRLNGRVIEEYPILSQFNYALAWVPVGAGGLSLDATDPYRPSKMLPLRALVDRGWVSDADNPRWVTIKSQGAYRRQTYGTARIDDSGTVHGEISGSDSGYSAVESFEMLEDGTVEDYVRDEIIDLPAEVRLDSTDTIESDTSPDMFMWEAKYAVVDYAQIAGDFIYVTPTIANQIADNPLKMADRSFPIDLAYPRSTTFVLDLHVPEGYVVEEAPGPVRINAVGGDAMYRRAVEVQDGIVKMSCRFNLKKAMFASPYYHELQQFFADVIAAEQDQLVLKRETGE